MGWFLGGTFQEVECDGPFFVLSFISYIGASFRDSGKWKVGRVVMDGSHKTPGIEYLDGEETLTTV